VRARLLEPTDIAWLCAFRALFGLTMAVSIWRFLANGWVERFFVEPRFFFKYWGFAWVEPLSASGMHVLVVALGILALCIAVGVAFRASALLFAAGFSYLQLIDVSNYLNHYYLAALLAWLLLLSPAGRSWSVDAEIRRRWSRGGAPSSEWVAAVWLYLFRLQIALVYAFAAVAKLQPDWLIHAQPLRIWLAASAELPLLGPVLALPGTPLLMSWLGFLFDATIVLWLSWSRTRLYAYAVLIAFHALTRALFPIGMFPVIMALSALVFFAPGWPRTLASHLGWRMAPAAAPALSPTARASVRSKVALALVASYCAIQLALPLRFLAYGGDVLWHEQGMRFSWRVMVRAKGGSTTFVVKNRRTGRVWYVAPSAYLTALQESEMASQPDLILQLAHHIREDVERRGLGPAEIRVDSRVSLNGRRGSPLIDPATDLATVSDGLARQPWILPAPPTSAPHTRVSL